MVIHFKPLFVSRYVIIFHLSKHKKMIKEHLCKTLKLEDLRRSDSYLQVFLNNQRVLSLEKYCFLRNISDRWNYLQVTSSFLLQFRTVDHHNNRNEAVESKFHCHTKTTHCSHLDSSFLPIRFSWPFGNLSHRLLRHVYLCGQGNLLCCYYF